MKQESKFIIALDGPAGSGKSSVATVLAQKLGCIHADSGAMYRTLTLACMRKLGVGKSYEEFGQLFETQLDLEPATLGCSVKVGDDKKQHNFIQDNDVWDEIRTVEVTARIRYIANSRMFRDEVNRMLRELADQTNVIVDGRDIGSVVFPDTPWKFYLDASTAIRAKRRHLEYETKNMEAETSLQELEEQIARRDQEDRERPFGALKQAPGAILIDTSSMNQNAVVQYLLAQLQIKF